MMSVKQRPKLAVLLNVVVSGSGWTWRVSKLACLKTTQKSIWYFKLATFSSWCYQEIQWGSWFPSVFLCFLIRAVYKCSTVIPCAFDGSCQLYSVTQAPPNPFIQLVSAFIDRLDTCFRWVHRLCCTSACNRKVALSYPGNNPERSQDEKDWKLMVEDRGMCDKDKMIDAERWGQVQQCEAFASGITFAQTKTDPCWSKCMRWR